MWYDNPDGYLSRDGGFSFAAITPNLAGQTAQNRNANLEFENPSGSGRVALVGAIRAMYVAGSGATDRWREMTVRLTGTTDRPTTPVTRNNRRLGSPVTSVCTVKADSVLNPVTGGTLFGPVSIPTRDTADWAARLWLSEEGPLIVPPGQYFDLSIGIPLDATQVGQVYYEVYWVERPFFG